jgi:serine/threonine protein kinase
MSEGPHGRLPTRDAFDETVLPDTAAAPHDTEVAGTSRDSRPIVLPAPGYDFGPVIGQGGMGEVVSAHDRRIGRDVAIKRMRATAPTVAQTNRFLREARVQARLDHPAIVPVHELGIDAAGRPFFTMKRLAGVTLAQRISDAWSVQRLLRAFADVCLAIEFAHTRGIIHRDLKPANIMLGDYGEVYVLDWGIARVLAEPDAPAEPIDMAAAIDTLETATKTGEMLGTPGYMAPEQIRGQPAMPKTDVYALGAIMFEILTGEPLHPHGIQGLANTLATPQEMPSKRAAGATIAPELDLVCFAALAESPDERPTARELGDRVQRYLDGDRDIERRRALASGELAVARIAFESEDPEQRAAAIHSAGRALALDPSSTEAAALVTRLMVEPPRNIPHALAEGLVVGDRSDGMQRARLSIGALMSLAVVLIVLPWMEVRSWLTLAVTIGTMVGATAWIYLASRRGAVGPLRVLVVTFVLTVAFTRVVGSFMLTPVLTAGCLFSMTANPWVRDRRYVVYLWLALSFAVPIVLEALGVFARTTDLAGGGMATVSPIFRGQGLADAIGLIVANFLLLATMAGFAIATNRQIAVARRELRTQAWTLHQLLPKIAHEVR